jgi:hypothetical protein
LAECWQTSKRWDCVIPAHACRSGSGTCLTLRGHGSGTWRRAPADDQAHTKHEPQVTPLAFLSVSRATSLGARRLSIHDSRIRPAPVARTIPQIPQDHSAIQCAPRAWKAPERADTHWRQGLSVCFLRRSRSVDGARSGPVPAKRGLALVLIASEASDGHLVAAAEAGLRHLPLLKTRKGPV